MLFSFKNFCQKNIVTDTKAKAVLWEEKVFEIVGNFSGSIQISVYTVVWHWLDGRPCSFYLPPYNLDTWFPSLLENEGDCLSENSGVTSPQSKPKSSIRRAQSAEKPSPPKSVPITKLASFSLDRIASASSIQSLSGSPAKLTATSASR